MGGDAQGPMADTRIGTRWFGVLALAVFFHLSPLASPRTIFPWNQEGQNPAHTWSNAGPSPGTHVPFWTSSSGGGITHVGAVAEGFVLAWRENGVIALDEFSGAVVRTFPVSFLDRATGNPGGVKHRLDSR